MITQQRRHYYLRGEWARLVYDWTLLRSLPSIPKDGFSQLGVLYALVRQCSPLGQCEMHQVARGSYG
jgi:hypothetical protein